MRSFWLILLAGGTMAAVLAAQSQSGGTNPAPGVGAATEWPSYRHDQAGTGYSPLTQIDARNVASLTQAWTYSLQPTAPAPGGRGGAAAVNSQATPIVVNGTLYMPAADRVVALNPETGEVIWQHIVAGGALSRRGVAYWGGDGTRPPRIIFMAGRRLIAVNAKTGERDLGFGSDGGVVDIGVPYNSVPLVYKNVVVVGANTPPGSVGGVGNPRAFDARTGGKLWEFNSVAQPGEPGHDTWDGESWKGRLGANAWPFYFTLDEQRGLLYLPLASPIVGPYGGDRKGANLYGNSVVAVDVQTGKYKWHFQTIHHDLWDHDPPAPPALFDITRNGRTVPALGVTTKSGYLYILNRETGQPDLRRRRARGREERRAGRGRVFDAADPGEAAAARPRRVQA